MGIEAIRSRLEGTSRGPWRAARAGSVVLCHDLPGADGKPYVMHSEDDCIIGPDGGEIMGCSEWMRAEWEDLEFMAHAKQDIEDLLAEVARLTLLARVPDGESL